MQSVISESQIQAAWAKALILEGQDPVLLRMSCDLTGATIRRDKYERRGEKLAWRISNDGLPVYAGSRPYFVVAAMMARQQKEQQASLEAARQDKARKRNMEDNPPRLISQIDLELAALKILKEGDEHRINLIGREFQRGRIESELGTTFDSEARVRCAKALDALLGKELIQPTYRDFVDPERWYQITKKGCAATESQLVDELDHFLMSISPELPERKRGCWHAINSGGPDWQRQAAVSAREMIIKVLHLAAPTDKVKSQDWFDPDQASGRITRKQRIRYVRQIRASCRSKSSEGLLNIECEYLEKLLDHLSAAVHGSSNATRSEFEAIQTRVEALLTSLLKQD